jgi:hypothetical protein
MQQPDLFGGYLIDHGVDAGKIAPRPDEIGDETRPNSIHACVEDDGNGRGRRLGRERRSCARRNNNSDPSANKISRQFRQSSQIIGPAMFDCQGFGPRRTHYHPRPCQPLPRTHCRYAY